jgi:hypothetical protein
MTKYYEDNQDKLKEMMADILMKYLKYLMSFTTSIRTRSCISQSRCMLGSNTFM